MDPRLARFLEIESERLRLRFHRALPLLGALLLPAAAIQLLIEPTSGAVYLLFALCGAGLPLALDDRRAPRLNMIVVALVPVVASAVIQLTRGPFIAGSTYLVPILFCAVVGIVGFHLHPQRVLVVGGLAVAFHALNVALLLRPALDPALRDSGPFDWVSQATRMVFMLAFVGAAARAVSVVRLLFFNAATAARAAELFAKYRLERQVGSGGMGEVWAATYCPEGGFVRPVAVKMIHDRLAADETFVSAFRREAELSARLLHKNIVQVLDFGREGARWFLTMEYVDGVPLSGLLRRLRRRMQRLSPSLALYVAREVVAAVAYAHREATDLQGRPLRVIHRDLAPANVLISRTGQVKVTDFGVAWVRGAAAGSRGFAGLVGHYGYLAPEQARGGQPDEQADLYAVGVMLWEMLTCRRLFGGRSAESLAFDVENQQVRAPASVVPALGSGPWDVILARTLSDHPGARYPSARALGDALTRALDEVGWPIDRDLGALVDGAAGVQRPVAAAPSGEATFIEEAVDEASEEGSDEDTEDRATELLACDPTTPGHRARAA